MDFNGSYVVRLYRNWWTSSVTFLTSTGQLVDVILYVWIDSGGPSLSHIKRLYRN